MIQSSMTAVTPLPRLTGDAATRIADSRLMGPSGLMPVGGRCSPAMVPPVATTRTLGKACRSCAAATPAIDKTRRGNAARLNEVMPVYPPTLTAPRREPGRAGYGDRNHLALRRSPGPRDA